MTLTEGTSTEIAQHLDNDALRMRETYAAGTFGQNLPPLPTMSARYHFLSGIESDAERWPGSRRSGMSSTGS